MGSGMACIEKRLYLTEHKCLIPDLLNERKGLIFKSIVEFSNSSTFPNSIKLNVEFRDFFEISRNCRSGSFVPAERNWPFLVLSPNTFVLVALARPFVSQPEKIQKKWSAGSRLCPSIF
jgi:hypothetical protein